MVETFNIIGPVFGLIGLGILAARLKLVGSAAAAGLSDYVFVMAIPALLFRSLATSTAPGIDPFAYWASYFIPLAAIWILALVIARRAFRTGMTEAVIAGFAAAQANTVLIGIPLVVATFGDRALPAVLLIVGIHLPVTIASATIAIEVLNGRRPSIGGLLGKLASHPIIVAMLAGIAWRLIGLPIPGPVLTGLKLLGDSAAPGALVATGLSLAAHGFSGLGPMIGVFGLMKLVAQPVLVFLTAHVAFGLPPLYTGVALLLAACPTGINAYLLAQRYHEGVAFTSGLVAATTAASMLTLSLAVAFILGGFG